MSRPFWWFEGSSVIELAARLNAAGPDHCRLEVRVDDEHPARKMTFRVVPKDVSALESAAKMADINESFLCPPRCPE